MTRLMHLSDIHFNGHNTGAVAAATAFAHEGGFDLIVVTGDLTVAGHPTEFAAAARWLAELPGPVLTTPGNHDVPVPGVIDRLTDPFRRFGRVIGPVEGQAFDSAAVSVRAVNTARGVQPRLNWSKGQADRKRFRAAAEGLAAAPAEALRVIACHHPLLEMVGAPMTGRVWGGRFAAEVVTRAGCDLVLTGHVHTPFVFPMPFTDGHTYAVGSGTLSIRERGTPPGFNVIEIGEREVTIVAQGWTGARFEPWRTWTVERRPRA